MNCVFWGDGRFLRLFRSITKSQLLILDDRGPDPFTAMQRHDLMEIIEEQYGRESIMIMSQLPFGFASSTTPIAWNSKASLCGKATPNG